MNIITKWFKERALHKAEERLAEVKAMLAETDKYHESGRPGVRPYNMVNNMVSWKGEVAVLTVRIARLQEQLGNKK